MGLAVLWLRSKVRNTALGSDFSFPVYIHTSLIFLQQTQIPGSHPSLAESESTRTQSETLYLSKSYLWRIHFDIWQN